MSNSNRARSLASAPKRASAISVLHEQAQKANSTGAITGGGYAGEPVGFATQASESEVSREVSNLAHNIDELHLALGRLEERLVPVMANFPPMHGGDSAAIATDSPLGGVLQQHAFSVHNAIDRVHALMNAIRI